MERLRLDQFCQRWWLPIDGGLLRSASICAPLTIQEEVMRTAARNRTMLAFVLTLLSAAVMVGAASTAYADDCLALGGNPAFLPGECRIDSARTASDATLGGPFTISEPLRITGAGSILVPAAPGG